MKRFDSMAAWHMPGGQVGPPARLAATSNVEVPVVQTTYSGNRGMKGGERRERETKTVMGNCKI